MDMGKLIRVGNKIFEGKFLLTFPAEYLPGAHYTFSTEFIEPFSPPTFVDSLLFL